MPRKDDVTIGVGFDIHDVDTSEINKSLSKGIKSFGKELQNAVNKISKTTLSRSLGALFGKDTSSDLIQELKENEQAIKDFDKAYLEHSKNVKKAQQSLEGKKLVGAADAEHAAKRLKELEADEKTLPSRLAQAKQMYASNMGAVARTNDPIRKAAAQNRAKRWKAEMEALQRKRQQ